MSRPIGIYTSFTESYGRPINSKNTNVHVQNTAIRYIFSSHCTLCLYRHYLIPILIKDQCTRISGSLSYMMPYINSLSFNLWSFKCLLFIFIIFLLMKMSWYSLNSWHLHVVRQLMRRYVTSGIVLPQECSFRARSIVTPWRDVAEHTVGVRCSDIHGTRYETHAE